MKLYLIDFDGTIFRKNSMIEFLKKLEPNLFFFYLKNIVFLPIYFLFVIKVLSRKKAKSIFLMIHLKNIEKSYIEMKSKEFSKEVSKSFFPGVKKFLTHAEGVKCIVTASADLWMEDIADEINCNLISSKVVFKEKKFNKISINCYGENKSIEIKKKYNLTDFSEIHVFGNSKGDKNMMSLATHKYYNFFN